MSSNVKEAFSPAGSTTSITCTYGTLTSSGTVGRASTAVDNSTNLFLDALVTATIQYPNSAPANDKAIYMYAYGSIDGSTYPEGITGSDASYTIQGSAGALTTALRPIGTIPAVQNTNVTYGPFAVAPAFGGWLPYKWGLVMLNFSGQTLTAGTVQFVGVYTTVG